MPDTSKLEKLNRELEKSEKKLRKAINDEKALQHQLKQTMTAENHSPPARSLRRTQYTNIWVVYNCALSKLRGFRLLPFQQFFQ